MECLTIKNKRRRIFFLIFFLIFDHLIKIKCNKLLANHLAKAKILQTSKYYLILTLICPKNRLNSKYLILKFYVWFWNRYFQARLWIVMYLIHYGFAVHVDDFSTEVQALYMYSVGVAGLKTGNPRNPHNFKFVLHLFFQLLRYYIYIYVYIVLG